jgi:hypothetical protein
MDEVEESKKWMIIFDNYLDLGKKKRMDLSIPLSIHVASSVLI